jgi:hypothetical protein
MKLRYVATCLMAALAAAAIAAMPIASATNPSTTTETGRTTTVDRQGHNSIVVHPPKVSPPKVYGPFTTPWPIILFD